MVEAVKGIFVFLLGICVGSFLNVCIYRMGREKSVVKPGSQCPSCGHLIRWYDNIPLLSFVLLKARCRDCQAPISFRYFLVEFLTGILFVFLWLRFSLTPIFFIYGALAAGLIVATFVDFDFRIIPDEISVGGAVLGLLVSVIYPALQGSENHWIGLRESVLGLVVGGGILWVLGCLGDFLFKKESMGGGDIKLLAMIGAFMGWKVALLTLPVASVFGAIVGIIVKLRTKESVIAFGPYLSLAAIVNIFWASQILDFFFLI